MNEFNKLTKTDRILLLILEMVKRPYLSMPEEEIKTILGNPSRAQWYKLIKELCESVDNRPALLKEVCKGFYQLCPQYVPEQK